MRRLACTGLTVFFLSSLASGATSEPPALTDKHPVRIRVIADVEQAALGEEFAVGVLIEMAPAWHIYWTFPGNTGKPTRVDFHSDELHTKVLPPGFPAPQVFDSDQPEHLSFGYSGSVLIPADAMTFDAPPGGSTTIRATVAYMACRTSCIPGKARASLTLPVGDAPRPSGQVPLFKRFRAQVPEPLGEERARLESLTFREGRYDLSFVLSGFESVEYFIPSWPTGGTCRVTSYGVDTDPRGRTVARLTLQGGNCLPGAGGVALGRPAGAPENSPTRAFSIAAHRTPSSGPAPSAAPTGADEKIKPVGGGTEKSFLWMLLFAFLGGMLLNIMPCVIPVVVPKLLHVVRTAQKSEDPAERRRLLWSNALAYTGGVVATMLALGVVVVVLKAVGHEVGWGFQFQNPWFLVFMIALLLVAGLGMLKTFSLKRSCSLDDLRQLRRVRRRSPLMESFLTGLLVTFLGTPCTAPLLGPALGYAFTAPSGQILLFLFTVGLGLSAPFLLLGAWTGWARILPTRVTERYDRVMRFMAFLMFGTAVWLISVLAEAYGVEAAMNMLWFLLVLGLAAWIFGLLTCDDDPWRKRVVRLLPLAVLVGLFGAWVLEFPEGAAARSAMLHSKVGIAWEPFSEERVRQLRASGKTVFIDFTAGWCMNCKANERLFIETQATKSLLDELGVASLKADFTRHDPVVHKWLGRFGRAGVPMYVIFPACQDDRKAILLPEILTSGILHDALGRAGPSRDSCGMP